MGIDPNTLRFLLAARERGVRFTSMVTIGRHLMQVRARHIRRLGLAPGAERILLDACGQYAEPLWSLLGAEQVTSIDASDYEGATVRHDMNRPIPETLKQQFDMVGDFGSLEHIFNVPTALSNSMEMVKQGGHLLAVLPASNYCGHGFYQFSPELFYRVFSEENGFRVERMIVAESEAEFRWYEVPDAAVLRKRTMFSASGRYVVMVDAVRREIVPPFRTTPQQSDYSIQWDGGTVQQSYRTGTGIIRVAGRIGSAVEGRIPGANAAVAFLRYAFLRAALTKRALTGHPPFSRIGVTSPADPALRVAEAP